jgi:DNA-directed RNA polymerase subunit RPC12/RpoP
MMLAAAVCYRCGEPLAFTTRGWVHREGGGAYLMRCPDCSWRGSPYPSPVRCPDCGSRGLRDDHCALPLRS